MRFGVQSRRRFDVSHGRSWSATASRGLALACLGLVLLVPAGRAQVRMPDQIRFPRLPEFTIPEPEVYALGNGMRVYLLEDHELPLIEVTARIRTGSNYEPAAKAGLARLMGVVQRTGGTATRTGDEINQLLEARAASVETSVSANHGSASMDCLKEDFDAVFALFADVLRAPRFAEEKLGLAKVQANTAVARRNDDVGGITNREFSRLIYGADSPLVRQEEYATIAALSREDLVAWHGAYYHPNNVMLGVVGDFDAASMKKAIDANFGGWAQGPPAPQPEIPYRKAPPAGVYFIEKSDVNQANIALGHLGITYHNPDYFAVQVLNEVLGGAFSSRLFSKIRTEKGLAYSVFGFVGAGFSYPGVTRLGLQTKSSSMAEAVDALYAEMRGMISSPPTQEEITRAKDAILNSFIFNYASNSQVLAQQMLYDYYGLPAEFMEQYRSNVERVTVEDTARVAKSYLRPEEATLLVVGKPADFDRPVGSFGSTTRLDIAIPPPPDTMPKVAKTVEGLEAGREALAQVAEIMGGENISEVKAIKTRTTLVVSLAGQSISLAQAGVTVFPDKQHLTVNTPAGQQVMVLDGEEGFAVAGGQTQPLPAALVEEQRRGLGRELTSLVRYAAGREMEAVAAGEEEVEGVLCQILAVSLHGSESRLWVATDGTVRKQTYGGNHPLTRAPGQFVIHFSDYRDAKGWRLPHQWRIEIDGEEFARATLESFEVDPDLPPTLFEKPEV